MVQDLGNIDQEIQHGQSFVERSGESLYASATLWSLFRQKILGPISSRFKISAVDKIFLFGRVDQFFLVSDGTAILLISGMIYIPGVG